MNDMGMELRRARVEDAPGCMAIYRPIVTDTAISFELTVPSDDEFARRIGSYLASHDWWVAEAGGQVAGYAYGSTHRPREAYGRSVETSVYVHPDYYGQGLGVALYERLFVALAERGFHQAFAGITLPNSASVALHRRLGFENVGVFREVGFKHQQWHDVLWMQRLVGPRSDGDSAVAE